jgi:glycosyltransferase involved in cell wall biosynthesis
MKVVVIPSWYLPFGGNFFEDHARSLVKEGHEVTVLVSELNSLKTFSVKKYLFRREIEIVDKLGLREIRNLYWKIPFSESINIRMQTRHIHKLFRFYIKKFGRPDIIHAHCTFFAGYAASLLKRKYNIPYVILENRGRFVEGNPFAKEILQEHQVPFIRKALAGADQVETVCYRIQPTFERIEPSTRGIMHKCPNAVDVDFFTPLDEEKNIPRFMFFCAGMLQPVKGIDILLQSMQVLLKKYPGKIGLRIAGKGYQEEFLKELSSSLKLNDAVKFLGQLDRASLREEMQHCNAFVLPSRFEAFGVVYVEALACGKPVIGARAGGPDDTIIPEVGYLVDVDDPPALASAMEKMYLKCHEFDRDFIRSHAVKNFSLDAVGKIHTRVFNKALNEKNTTS